MRKSEELKEEVRKKEGELGALKYRTNGGNALSEGEKDYVYYFSESDIFDPVEERVESSYSEYEGLGRLSSLLYAAALTLFYTLIVFAALPILKKKKGEKNGRDN